MEEITAWAHLPNAKHIDRVHLHVDKNGSKWSMAGAIVESRYPHSGADTAIEVVRRSMFDLATALDRFEDLQVTRGAVRRKANIVWLAATDATDALVAWDDCAYILDLHPDVVRLMAASGNEPAILMEAAVIAMHEETEL